MSENDTRRVVNYVWGLQAPSTQGVGKPKRGVGVKKRRDAGVVIDVPAPPSVLKLSQELLQLQAAKDSKAISGSPAVSKDAIPTITSQEFVDILLKPSPSRHLKSRFIIDCLNTPIQFEPYTEGCDWAKSGMKGVVTTNVPKIRMVGLSPFLKSGKSVVIKSGGRTIGRLTFEELSPELIATGKLDDITKPDSVRIAVSNRTDDLERDKARRKELILSFRRSARAFDEVFATNETLLKYSEGTGSRYVILGPVTMSANVLTSSHTSLETLNKSPRVSLKALKESADQAKETGDYSKIFGQHSSLAVYDTEAGLWPTAIIQKIDDTFSVHPEP